MLFFSSEPLANSLKTHLKTLRYWGITPLLLLLIMGVSVWVNPLQYGLSGTYYGNNDQLGEPLLHARDTMLNLWRMQTTFPDHPEDYSIVWAGVLFAPTDGEYSFYTRSDDGTELTINQQRVIEHLGQHEFQEHSGQILLKKGFHDLTIRYAQSIGGADFQIYWKPPQSRHYERLARAILLPAKPSDSAFFIGRCLSMLSQTALLLIVLWTVFSLILGLSHRRSLGALFASTAIGRRLLQIRAHFVTPADAPQPTPPPRSRRRSLIINFGALFGYIVLGMIWTFPLIRDFSTKVTGLGGDRYIWLWDMWWMKTALLALQRSPLFTDYLFYPQGVELSFHDSMWLNSLLSVPLQAFFSLGEIYNLLFLASYVLGGFGMFLLGRYLTGNPLAAFVSGLVFPFWGGRFYFCDHLSSASIQWFPYVLLYLFKTHRERSYRYPVLAALFWAMSALSGWYNAVFISCVIGLWEVYSACRRPREYFSFISLRRLALLALLFLLLVLPFTYPMFRDLFSRQGYMNYQVITQESASPNLLFLPGVNHGFLGKYMRYLYFRFDKPMEWGVPGAAFIGYTVLLLGLYVAVRGKRREVWFWLGAALLFTLFACGPHLRLFAQSTGIPMPYQLLQHIPILKIVRLPIRFMIPAMLCYGVAVGYACQQLFQRIRFHKTLFLFLSACILFEFYRPLYIRPIEDTPSFYTTLANDPDRSGAILELTRPGAWEHTAVRASLFQITHQRKLFHGHVSRVPLEAYYQTYFIYAPFADLLTQPVEYFDTTEFSLETHARRLQAILAYYRTQYVTLYYDYPRGDFTENLRRLEQIFDTPIGRDTGTRLFRVTPAPAAQNVVFPGFGMEPLDFSPGEVPARGASQNAEYKILNVEGTSEVRLQFELKSNREAAPQTIEILMNQQVVTTVTVADWVRVEVTAPLQPGENTIRFRLAGEGYSNWQNGIYQERTDFYLRLISTE